MICPVCQTDNPATFDKSGVDYHVCRNCQTCYSVALPNENMIGGIAEDERKADNLERIRRFRLYGCTSLLDFGCGHGYLVADARGQGIDAHGYDRYNPEFSKLPAGSVDVVSMVEVVEHMVAPFYELNMVWDYLKPKGHVYIETSFTDIGKGIGELKDFFYISPEAGHSTIFSHSGLDRLMIAKGFTPKQHINPTVRIYQK